MIKLARLKRRTQHERFGERMPSKKTHWEKLFPEEGKMFSRWKKVEPKIKARIENQKQEEAQKIGKRREEKVMEALKELKQKGKIHDFPPKPAGLSYLDLMEGIDFEFIYIDSYCYRICRFSVTGKDWVQEHLKRHPEVPVLAIGLQETQKSIEEKILALKAEFQLKRKR